ASVRASRTTSTRAPASPSPGPSVGRRVVDEVRKAGSCAELALALGPSRLSRRQVAVHRFWATRLKVRFLAPPPACLGIGAVVRDGARNRRLQSVGASQARDRAPPRPPQPRPAVRALPIALAWRAAVEAMTRGCPSPDRVPSRPLP